MRAMPFRVQGQGVLDVVVQGAAGSATPELSSVFGRATECNSGGGKRKRELVEPRSVLDQRRSPSPPTSTSTLSSSLYGSGGGGAASSDTASVAAVSDSNKPPPSSASHHNTWPPYADSTPSSAPPTHADLDSKKEADWAAELQPIPSGLDMGILGSGKCGTLAGVDDWEAILGDTAAGTVAASPSHEQTFLRWFMGDMDDPSNLCNVKQQSAQHLHPQATVNATAADFDLSSAALAFGIVDPVSFGRDTISSAAAAPATNNSPGSYTFPPTSNTSRGAPPVQQQFQSIRVTSFGNGPTFSSQAMNSLPVQPGLIFQDAGAVEEKPLLPQVLGPEGLLLNQSQNQPNPPFFIPITQPEHGIPLQSVPLKRHHALTLGAGGSPSEMLLLRSQPPQPHQLQHLHHHQQHLPGVPYLLQHRIMKPKSGEDEAAAAQQRQQQALVDQLFKAAELVEAGSAVGARGILARLNQQLPLPVGKPLHRSAFYFKEALQNLLNSPTNSSHQNPPSPAASLLDVAFKISAYKSFSEVSPVIQFTNFTCVQTLLEELGPAERIHILDFDIGNGGQWSSFMQGLPKRRCTTIATAAVPPFLKITSFVSPSAHHPTELDLTRENLSHFAADLKIPFEFNVFLLDSFDPATVLAMSGGADEAIAVNLPVCSAYASSIPTILRLVKQLSPKIVVSVDHGCDRSDLQFSHHFLHALQSSTVLLDSIDAAGATPDVVNKIERFLLQPRIENSVLSHHRAGEKILPWRSLFASAGFLPVQFSNFTESQAECLLKRVQVRGFHVEKRQASLSLYWQRGELASVSAWRC